mgnify:CR=1 FL=1
MTPLTLTEWRAMGVYALIVLATGLYDERLAWALVTVFLAVVLLRNAGQIAAWVGKVSG